MLNPPAGSTQTIQPTTVGGFTSLSILTSDSLRGVYLLSAPGIIESIVSTDGLISVNQIQDDLGNTFLLVGFDRSAILTFFGSDGNGVFGARTQIQAGDPLVFPGAGIEEESFTGIGSLSNLAGAGAQVRLTGSLIGSALTLSKGDHRHAFSGRFAIDGFLAQAVGAGLPLKFQRFKFGNAFTIRRISVYAQTAPTVGSDTFGIVNAAGILQGTAVVLAAGTLENEVAQTTNLLANTAYYIAETASSATVQATGINISVEYVMNV